MIKAENRKISMVEGDFGLPLPITIIGENIQSSENIKFSLKTTDNEEAISPKIYTNIVDNTFELEFSKEESEKLNAGTYFYYIDWYNGDTFLANIVNGEEFKVEVK